MSQEARPPGEGAAETPYGAEPQPVLEPGGTAAETSAHPRGAGELGPGTTRRRGLGKAGRSVRKHATAERRKPETKLPRKQHVATGRPATGKGRFKPLRTAEGAWTTEEKVAGRKPKAKQKKEIKGAAATKKTAAKKTVAKKLVAAKTAARRAAARSKVLTAPVVPPAGPLGPATRATRATRMGDARVPSPRAKGAPLRHRPAPPRKRPR